MKFIKKYSLFLFVIILIVFLSNLLLGLKARNEASKIPPISEDIQLTWNNIDSNILGYLQLSGILAETYGYVVDDSEYLKMFTNMNYDYKTKVSMQEKIIAYNDLIEFNSTLITKSNKLIKDSNSEDTNLIVLNSTIDKIKNTEKAITILIDEYNKSILEYNHIVNKSKNLLFPNNLPIRETIKLH